MAFVAPIIVVLGPYCGGTSAVAKVLHHLGVFMGTTFDWSYREPHDTWEDSGVSQLCRRAFREPGGQLRMDAGTLEAKLRSWADNHRRAARTAGCPPGVKHPMLCVAIDFIRDTWGPVVPVVVDRPVADVVASLNRLGWWKDEQERDASTAHLIATRDRALADAETVRVDFAALRTTPADAIRRLAEELGLAVTEAQVEAAVQSVVQPEDVRDMDPYKQSIDLRLTEVKRKPEDARSVFLLAETYFDSGDFVNARKWYARHVEMGGSGEGGYHSRLRVAESMAQLDTPWPEVQDAYLRAWEFRPTRAEALYFLAFRCRVDKRYQLGYLYAQRAAQIPLPEEDMAFDHDVLAWRATEEQATCAWWIGNRAEAFALYRRLLARPDLPDEARHRIANNRDTSVPAMLEAASSYPETVLNTIAIGTRDTDITVSLIAGPDHTTTEQTLNSFLQCCTDVPRIGRFLALNAGISAPDRATLQQRYRLLEFAECGPGAQLAQTRQQIHGRFWLHLGHGWQFFAPENFITRLTAVLDAEPHVFQVGINVDDAFKLTGTSAAEQTVRHTPDAGRYVLTDAVANGPAMFDTTRLDQAGGVDDTGLDSIAQLGRRATAAGLHTATLDEVLCITAN